MTDVTVRAFLGVPSLQSSMTYDWFCHQVPHLSSRVLNKLYGILGQQLSDDVNILDRVKSGSDSPFDETIRNRMAHCEAIQSKVAQVLCKRGEMSDNNKSWS